MGEESVETRATALGHLHVLEVATDVGELFGKLLADLGADVVRIEPPGGDTAHRAVFQGRLWRPVRFAAVVPCASLRPLFRHCVGGGRLATFTQESVITRILRHLKLASVPPPIVPARLRQETFVFADAYASVSP